MSEGDRDAVFVEAAARLHFGVLDLRGSLGRWFGGIGASAPGPSLLLSASRSDGWPARWLPPASEAHCLAAYAARSAGESALSWLVSTAGLRWKVGISATSSTA